MNDFIKTLSGVEKVLYKASYEFHLEHSPNATPESAHEAGLQKIASLKKFKRTQTYVNLSTGKKFNCTESQLTSKYA